MKRYLLYTHQNRYIKRPDRMFAINIYIYICILKKGSEYKETLMRC